MRLFDKWWKYPLAVIVILSAIYITNLGAGIIEFIPDNLPIVGNVDEAIAGLFIAYGLGWMVKK